MTVSGGTPTLTLNDGGTATYVSGSGTKALIFSYTVGASNTNVAALQATAVNLNGAKIANGAGTAATLSLTGLTQSGPQIDVTTPTITAIANSPASGSLGVGKTVTFTLTLNDIVTVSGGTPTLTLNDGGTATYASGSGTQSAGLLLHGGGVEHQRVGASGLGGEPQWSEDRQRGGDGGDPVAERADAKRTGNRGHQRKCHRIDQLFGRWRQ